MRRGRGRRVARGLRAGAAAAAAGLGLGVGSCPGPDPEELLLAFEAPGEGELAGRGSVPFRLRLRPPLAPQDVVLLLDGAPVAAGLLGPAAAPGAAAAGPRPLGRGARAPLPVRPPVAPARGAGRTPVVVSGTLADPGPGPHRLEARAVLPLPTPVDLRAATHFEIVDLDLAPGCEILNAAACLLPWPSSHFQAPAGAATETGVRLAIPQAGMPVLVGASLLPAPLDGFDGFSPTAPIQMHFPADLDLVASGAPRLLPARCCGQSPRTPYEGVRTLDGRSLEPGSPTVLLDLETGQRVAHFAELDARAADPARRVLFLRPAESLVPGHRYAVAVRRLVDRAGEPVEPEPVFRALRDGAPSRIPALEERRAGLEALFRELARAGVARRDLLLAFDFQVRSDRQLTGDLLALRDAGLAALDAEPFGAIFDAAFNAAPANFHPDCQATGAPFYRRVRGSFRSPFFLTPLPPPSLVPAPGYFGHQLLAREADGRPAQTGLHQVRFDILVPCSALAAGPGPPPLLVGHGLFQTGEQILDLIQQVGDLARAEELGGFEFLAGATDWRGLSGRDLGYVAVGVIGAGVHQLNSFPALVARLQQGVFDQLALAHALKTGRFNAFEPFQRVAGDPASGVFPGPEEAAYYYGISLGGIMGLLFAALTPDVERLAIDVGAMNFSLLLQRSTQFTAFEELLRGVGLADPMETAIGLAFLHEQWVVAEPAGTVRHVTGRVEAPLPGSPAKKLLLTAAWLDKQVSNQASEIAARSLGLANAEGSLVRGLLGIDDAAAGAESGYLVYDAGSFDVFDPAFDPVIPALANLIPSPVCDPHAQRIRIPAALEQLLDFLRPGGRVGNPCRDDGVCNASEAFERPGGLETVCDPLAGSAGAAAGAP